MENSIPKTKKLNNGLECPSIGLGTAKMTNISEVVYESIKQGARLIDTASIYENEKEVGEGITKALKENIVKREEMYVITKMSVFERGNPEKAVKQSLERLNLTYVDLYLDHWPLPFYTQNNEVKAKTPIHILWPKLEELIQKGYTKSIGVSNYNVQSMLNLQNKASIP